MFEVPSYFRWQDLLDILVVAFIIHQLISIIRGTRSVQMVLGLVILSIVYFVAKIFDLSALMWLMQTFELFAVNCNHCFPARYQKGINSGR